jgi:DNA-binding response OmpR family regulator
MRILVAEDDNLFREILQAVLEGLGHECVSVANGQEAWDYLQAEGAEVVITDWHMPKLTGLELCTRVRAAPEIVYPYFILLTATADHRDVVQALEAGVDDHLPKPPNMDELEARLVVARRVRALHLKLREDGAAN